MKCKKCKRTIEDNSIYCNWCGFKQLTDSNEVRVPVPRRKGNTWYAQILSNGGRTYVSAGSEEEYYAKARAVKSGLMATKKAAPMQAAFLLPSIYQPRPKSGQMLCRIVSS